MNNHLLVEPRFLEWLSDIQTILQQTQPAVTLKPTSFWKPVAFSQNPKQPRKASSESEDWIRVDYTTATREIRGWCWVCSKDDPTDPFGAIKEGLIIAPYNPGKGAMPIPGLRRNGYKITAFNICGNIYDEFSGLGFFDLRSCSWVKIRDRRSQIASYLSGQKNFEGVTK